MKRSLLVACSFLTAGLMSAQTIIVAEDFESYTAGDALSQTAGAPWSTWSGTPGGSEDALISTDQAASGTNSVEFEGTAAGGPLDMVLQLGDLTEGMYGIGWNMYVTAGNGGYFNIQHTETPGTEWGLDVVFLADGSFQMIADEDTTTGTYPQGEWFEVAMIINLDDSAGTLAIGGGAPMVWDFATQVTGGPGMNQLGGINFFSYAGGDDVPHYYIDDVIVVDITPVSVAENTSQEPMIYPNPVKDLLTIDLPVASGNAVVSVVDLTGRTIAEGTSFDQQGNIARTQIDMSGSPAGVYLIRIQDGANETVHRVVRN